LAISEPELAEPIFPGHPAVLAELVHAMRREMAITLGDLLIRRTHVFHEVSGHGIEFVSRIADLAAAEMGWDPERKEAEISAYRVEAELNSAFHRDMEGLSAPPSL
jgi:glycerol-3-phosphate dehydrogenase